MIGSWTFCKNIFPAAALFSFLGCFFSGLFDFVYDAVRLGNGQIEFFRNRRAGGTGFVRFNDLRVPFFVLRNDGIDLVFLPELVHCLTGYAELAADRVVGLQFFLQPDEFGFADPCHK
jgi:hypothetical protein